MKKSIYAFIAFLIVGMSVATAQHEVGAATLPDTVNFHGQELVYNGAGVRKKAWFKLYSGGLYLQNKSSNAYDIRTADETMVIRLYITSGMISSKKMINAVDEGFENSTNGNTAPIAAKIETFKNFFSEEINDGDIFDIAYIKDKGVYVYKNSKEQGIIPGLEFKKALFGIWLGSKPADKRLKKGMLGND
ncbi:chalcone isomerase family protein [Kordia sp.]|uniref:chalcone isomerase family protein n=1 Tax=Kordia sp. TaxID=1965332 RepID=UPI0025C11896|nr:chalcone isomerase family protein [Kordia sp.]MCH2197068.1 chalcone isomerase family protein [Kordia sp.]